MTKRNVEIGSTYAAKVSGERTHVRIVRESSFGGWEALNTRTGKIVRIKTAARLRPLAVDRAAAEWMKPAVTPW